MAGRDRESEVLKDSRPALSGRRILWAGPEVKDKDLSKWNVA